MKMFSEPQPVNRYLDTKLVCSCGRTHYADIKDVAVGPGAINRLPEFVRRHGYSYPFIVCDEITCKIAGKTCRDLLATSGIRCCLHVIRHMGFDEATLGELTIAIPPEADLVIAVGTGSITDMIRYMTFKLRLPCFTVATGAPMDGFAASIGVLNVNSLKKTMPAHNSEVIIGDTDILKGAPYRMSIAGFGDLIGKITCLKDWEISSCVNGEHICEPIVQLVRSCVADVLEKSPRLRERDPAVLGDVMNGLVLSGTAISLYGDSRPASGAEHHMSHYWETVMDQRGVRGSMHGEQVAVGTVLVLMLCEELRSLHPDFASARTKAAAWDAEVWKAEIQRAYGPAANEILALEEKTGKNASENVLPRISRIEACWPELCRLLEDLPTAEELITILRRIHCPAVPSEIAIDRSTLRDTFLYCKEVRERYTVFRLASDLGVLETLAERVMDRLDVVPAKKD